MVTAPVVGNHLKNVVMKKTKGKKIKVRSIVEVDKYLRGESARIVKHQLLYWDGKAYAWSEGKRLDFVLVK